MRYAYLRRAVKRVSRQDTPLSLLVVLPSAAAKTFAGWHKHGTIRAAVAAAAARGSARTGGAEHNVTQ